jgi:hypothetical protein
MHTCVIVIGDDPDGKLEKFCEYESDDGCSGMWDWGCMGGRWEGLLNLKSGKNVNQAKKSDVDFDKTDRIFGKAVVLNGEWHETTLQYDHTWPGMFLRLISTVGEDALISVFDCHS